MAGSQKVFLRIVGLIGDSSDADEMPDRVNVTGRGRLIPTIALGAGDVAQGPDSLHEIRLIEPVDFEIIDGMLTYDGKPYVWLPVPSGEWMWRITFDNLVVGDQLRELNDFVFPLDPATPAQIADENYPGINLAQYGIASWAPGTVNLTAEAIQQITIYLGRAGNAARDAEQAVQDTIDAGAVAKGEMEATAAAAEARIDVEHEHVHQDAAHVDQVAAQVAAALDQANVFAQDQVPPYLQKESLDTDYAPATGAVHLHEIAGSGDDDGPAIVAALAENGHLLGREGDVYTIKSMQTVELAPGSRIRIDLNGATLRFADGGGINIGKRYQTPFLTTGCSAGLVYGGTNFVVDSTLDVEEGDLLSIASPVTWVPGIPMTATYIVSDVDHETGQVWVEGRSVSEITPAQIADAGAIGEVTVSFYKVADSIELVNGTIDTTDKTGHDTLVGINGARRAVTRNLHILSPTRTGVNLLYIGHWSADECSVRDHGYVNRDMGYVNAPDAPGGYGFGYGFLCSHVYFAHIRNSHSFSGWHGFDTARGTTYTLFDGCVSHKDAYGWSTHEGSWIMHVRSCVALGGLGVTCRSLELIVDGNTRLETLHNCIGLGDGRLRVVLDGVTLSSREGSEVYMGSGSMQDYHRPANLRPLVIAKNITSAPHPRPLVLRTSGDAVVTGVTRIGQEGASDNDALQVIGNGVDSSVIFSNSDFVNVGQQTPLSAIDCRFIMLRNITQDGTVGIPSGSSILTVRSNDVTAPIEIRAHNVVGNGKIERIVRVFQGIPTVDAISNSGFRWLASGDGGRLRNALWNAVRTGTDNASIVLGTMTVTKNEGNITLAV